MEEIKIITDEELRALVKACGWREAKSMKQWPHEYAIIGKTVPEELYDEFQRFGRRLETEGYTRYFYSKEVFYLDLDGYCYWHMLPPKNPGEYDLINRAKLPNIASRVRGRGPNLDALSPIRAVRKAAGVTEAEEEASKMWR